MSEIYTIETQSDIHIIKQANKQMDLLDRSVYPPDPHFDYDIFPNDDYIVFVASIYLKDGDFWPIFELRFSKSIGTKAINEIFDLHISNRFKSMR